MDFNTLEDSDVNGTRTRLRSAVSLRAVADHSAAPRGRFAAILGSLSSESAPRVTSAPHLWTVGPTMASNRQYCVTVRVKRRLSTIREGDTQKQFLGFTTAPGTHLGLSELATIR